MITDIGTGADPGYAIHKRGAIVLGGSVCARSLPEAMEEIRAVAALRPDLSHDRVKIKVSADPGQHWTEEATSRCPGRGPRWKSGSGRTICVSNARAGGSASYKGRRPRP